MISVAGSSRGGSKSRVPRRVRGQLFLPALCLPSALELDVAIFLPSLVTQCQNYATIRKMLRVMISIMLLDALPTNIHYIAIVVAVH